MSKERKAPEERAPAEERARERREFLKVSAAAAAGLALGSALPAAGQVSKRANVNLNPGARSLMPDGRLLGRVDLLRALNLDPTTPPDAWLTIFSCSSNAGGLLARDARALMERGVLKRDQLTPHQVEQLAKLR